MPRLLALFGAVLVALCGAAASARAQIVVDGSIGSDCAVVERTDLQRFDLDHQIIFDARPDAPNSCGELVGRNLFHSFSRFDLRQPDGTRTSATFQAYGTDGETLSLDRVIARVLSDGQASVIEGVLRSEIDDADLFFLDPDGVIFTGQGFDDRLDVPADFYVSTADLVYFGPDAVFDVRESGPQVLSAAAPEAFGFAGDHRASVEFLSTGVFGPDAGRTLTVVAGDVEIDDDSVLQVTSGEFRFAAVGSSASVVPVDVARFDALSRPGELGTIRVGGSSDLQTLALSDSSAGQGRILLRSGELVVTGDSNVRAGGNAGSTGLALDIEAADRIRVESGSELKARGNADAGTGGASIRTDRMVVEGAGSIVGSHVSGGPGAGTFRVEANELRVIDGGEIQSRGTRGGTSGDLALDVERLEISDGGQLVSTAERADSRSGSIFIGAGAGRAQAVRVTRTSPAESAGQILLLSRTSDGGATGDLHIDARLVEIDEGGSVLSQSSATGAAGSITIEAAELRVATLGTIGSLAGEVAPGGDVTLRLDTMRLDSLGNVTTVTETARSGGALTVTASGDIEIVGDVASPDAATGLFARSAAGAAGDSGALDVSARNLTVTGNAVLSTRASGAGRSGDLTLDASGALRMSGDAFGRPDVSARTTDGTGGTLQITAGQLELGEGAAISTSSFGTGAAGDIVIVADDVVLGGRDLDGNRAEILGDASSQQPQAGDGGTISIVARRDVVVNEGGRISAESRGSGRAGGVVVTAGRDVRVTGGEISTQATNPSGGNIDVAAEQQILLVEGRIETNVRGAFGEGDAGNATLTAPSIAINAGTLRANATRGDGGNITVTAAAYVASSDSTIEASSDQGIDGEIETPPPDTALKGSLARLPAAFLDVSALLGSQCAARVGGAGGSFVMQERTRPVASPARALVAEMPLPPESDARMDATGARDVVDPIASLGPVASARPGLGAPCRAASAVEPFTSEPRP